MRVQISSQPQRSVIEWILANADIADESLAGTSRKSSSRWRRVRPLLGAVSAWMWVNTV